jgi:hypothetical protein
MRIGLKRLGVLALSAALFGGAGATRADSLAFATFGSFTAANHDTSLGGAALTTGSGRASVTAAFVPLFALYAVPSLPVSGAHIALGAIALIPYDLQPASKLSFDPDDRFNITLKELDPYATGNATLSAAIDGSLSFNPQNGHDAGSFTLDFGSSNSTVITGLDGRSFRYSLKPVTINVDTNVSAFSTSPSYGTLFADVMEVSAATPGNNPSPAPLPRSAAMGLTLLTALAGAAFVNRRRAIGG